MKIFTVMAVKTEIFPPNVPDLTHTLNVERKVTHKHAIESRVLWGVHCPQRRETYVYDQLNMDHHFSPTQQKGLVPTPLSGKMQRPVMCK